MRVFFFLLCLLPLAALADPPLTPEALRFARYTVEDGLPHQAVTSVHMDRQGFLWVGTIDGLARFDGQHFTTFRPDPADPHSISSPFIHGIVADAEGDLWIGTRTGGICEYRLATERFRCIRAQPGVPNRLQSDLIHLMFFDRTGQLWVSTDEATGLLDPETEVFRAVHFTTPSGEVLYTRVIYAGTEGYWIGAAGKLWYLPFPFPAPVGEPDRPLRLPLTPVPEVDGISQPAGFYEDTAGDLWFTTETQQVYVYSPDTGILRSFGLTMPDLADRPYGFAEYGGWMWITRADELVLLDKKTGAMHTAPTATNLYVDPSGRLWLTTWGQGLYRLLPPPRFQHWTQADGLTNNAVFSFAEDTDGSVWIGTNSGLTHRAPDGTFTPHYTTWDGTPLDNVWALWRGPEVLWIGTQRRGLCYRDRTPRIACLPPSRLADTNVYRVLQDRRGWLWIGYDTQGLDIVLNPEALRTGQPLRRLHLQTTPDSPLPDNYIKSLYEDATGAVWVGTQRGGVVRLSVWGFGADSLPRFEAEAFTADPGNPDRLPNPDVRATYRTADGRTWFATFGGGLAVWDGTRLQRYTRADGLANETLYGILPDDQGHLWLPTNNGLARFNPSTGRFRTYTERDGIQNREFNTGAWHRGRSGTLYAGGMHGANAFRPADFTAPASAPPLYLTGLRVFDEPRRLDQSLSAMDEIRLRHDEAFVTFEFIAPAFDEAEHLAYRYQLIGTDPHPNVTDAQAARYTALQPGHYRFVVEAFYRDAPERASRTEIGLVIVPPWWQTTGFRLLALALALAGLVMVVRFASQRKLRAQVRQLETERRVQQERERISRDLHDHLGAQLTGIASGLDLASRFADDQARREALLTALRSEARATIADLRGTIWTLGHPDTDTTAFADLLRRYCTDQARFLSEPTLSFTSDLEVAHPLSPNEALALFRITQEAVQNAVKHAGASFVSVHFASEPDAVTLSIFDDGTFQSPAPGHDGLGLAGMETRSQEISAAFSLATENGTAVTVTLPRTARNLLQTGDGFARPALRS